MPGCHPACSRALGDTLPCACFAAADATIAAVVPAAGEAGQVAAVHMIVCQVDVAWCDEDGPWERFAADGARVTGPVQDEAAFTFGLVGVAVAALCGGAAVAHYDRCHMGRPKPSQPANHHVTVCDEVMGGSAQAHMTDVMISGGRSARTGSRPMGSRDRGGSWASPA